MPPFNHYQYQALCAEDAIRLVVLDVATDEEAPLSCSLIQRPRSARHIEYFAISYTVGEREFTRTLEVIHDGDDTSYLRITSNVDALLRHLRTLNRARYLWIDAICLNQDDEIEKAQQVPKMGRIYEDAKGVHIWVGPSVPVTPTEAKQSQMAARIVFLIEKYFHGPGPGFRVIHGFFLRSWFSRRWVIQEACLARRATVHCGHCSIPLPVLASAARQFLNLDMSDYPTRMAANLRRPSAGLSILELLWNFHEAACLEPRDRIGALLGLIGEEGRYPMDYAAHWTELYKQAATFMLRTGGNNVRLQMLLQLFEFGPVVAPEDGSYYPSWVPDWTKTRRRHLPYHSRIKNVDTLEPYPSFPGHPALATLEFHHAALQIYGDALTATPHICGVTFAKIFLHPPRDEEQGAERVMAVLRELFTRWAGGCRTGRTSMPSVLRHASLLVLGPPGPELEARQGYGIGPQATQVGDMIVPLWYPERRSGAPFILPGEGVTAIKAMTMLVVRPTGDQCFQHEIPSSAEETRRGVPKAKVVGPALCVFPGALPGDIERLAGGQWAGNLDKGRCCFACLV
ncbi:heterokaryon incompatibility protein-domain-containing protein [Staphylotrichum tortipilum]|uniref:Heterokaryon incompatibility protein-domain-containing protein n=1 Tax=Staphylotrichum tortipilum TaxID=2831512 RepID=A0AAN6MDQ2_9PEZI|nr:heterokaryon incompatibility protein-domain-containing protein [Staphylotrichum longicolle]